MSRRGAPSKKVLREKRARFERAQAEMASKVKRLRGPRLPQGPKE
jgi:hypothetical protein